MSEAVDVGSVLGGRYKVTAYVLASADEDLVLEGMDQVLNRPVSILVASEGNASQVTATARELASGERDENIQVLDLSISDSRTYLVTNRAPAADMLDLIVQREPHPGAEAPHEEPFYTETLGSEIFGRSRTDEPEDDHQDYYEDDYDVEEDEGQSRPSRLAGLARRFGRREPDRTDDDADRFPEDAGQDDDETPPAGAVFTPRPGTHSVPPPPTRRPGGSAPASPSAESLPAASSAAGSSFASSSAARSEQDRAAEQNRDRSAGVGDTAMAAGAAGAAGAASQQPERSSSFFPLTDDQDDDVDGIGDSEEYEDADGGGRRFTRLLVGAVLTVGIIAAVVFAAITLGNLNSGNNPVADPQGQATEEPAEPAEPETTTAPATPSATPTPEPVAPVITGISRVVPDNQALDVGNDGTLPLIIDGDPATFWGNQVYASDTFGGLASNLALVLQLEQESSVSEVSITQISGSGGTFSVLLNDQPTLQGAEQVAQGSFTAPTITVPVPESADGQPTAQYVIVNFTQLPRLAIQAQFPFGLRIAEIEVD